MATAKYSAESLQVLSGLEMADYFGAVVGGDSPPEICLSVEASSNLNMFDGEAHVVVLYFYPLQNAQAFTSTDPQELLGGRGALALEIEAEVVDGDAHAPGAEGPQGLLDPGHVFDHLAFGDLQLQVGVLDAGVRHRLVDDIDEVGLEQLARGDIDRHTQRAAARSMPAGELPAGLLEDPASQG